MRVEIRELEIELIAENGHEQEALARLHRARKVEVKDGRTTSRNYPPSDRETNVVLVLPDPNDWGT
jgi:hypothetical protein